MQTDPEQTARAALQEIELDYQLGNLAESDYRFLRERYVWRASLAMKSREACEQELDEVIEEQVRLDGTQKSEPVAGQRVTLQTAQNDTVRDLMSQ